MWWLKLASIGKKALPYLVVAGGVIAVLGWVYDMGGDNREAAIRSELTKQYEKDVAGLSDKHKAALETQAESIRREYENIEAEKVIVTETKEVIKYVDKIIVDDSCKRLAIDTISLLKHASNIGAESP